MSLFAHLPQAAPKEDEKFWLNKQSKTHSFSENDCIIKIFGRKRKRGKWKIVLRISPGLFLRMHCGPGDVILLCLNDSFILPFLTKGAQ